MILGNTAALEAGGISQDSESPAGGEIGRDAEGKLNGLLYDQAMNAITDAIPKEGEAYIESLTDALNLAIDDMLSYGLTGGHTEDMHYFGKFTNPLTAYHRVIGEKHHFRVSLLRHNAVFEEMMEENATFDEPFIEPGAMKIFADGALGGSTAALSKPYSDQPDNKGLFIQTDEELEELVKLARKYDEPVAVHMIGDAGAEQVLNVIEKYPLTNGKRDRLIHCCVLREDLVERMAKLPVVLDLQPAFVPSDFPWVINRLGEDRLEWAYPWKKLIDRGLMCAAGTDAPVEDINPLASIYAAVERKKPYAEHEGYVPEEKLTRFQAIQLYTIGSAKAICKEHERGLIKPGYVADFSIFRRDGRAACRFGKSDVLSEVLECFRRCFGSGRRAFRLLLRRVESRLIASSATRMASMNGAAGASGVEVLPCHHELDLRVDQSRLLLSNRLRERGDFGDQLRVAFVDFRHGGGELGVLRQLRGGGL